MNPALSIGDLVLILLVSVTIHETAHAVAMRRLGVPVVEAGFGAPLPPRLSFTARGVRWVLTPWLVMGYVAPSEEGHEKLEALPYRDAAWYCNVGILANVLLMLGALASIPPFTLLGNALPAAIAVAAWRFRRQVTAYVIPALALPAAAIMTYGLIRSWSHGKSGVGFAGLGQFAPTDGRSFLLTFATINFALAALNTFPMYPTDNGRVVGRLVLSWFGSRVAAAFRYTGLALVFSSFAGAIVSDLYAAIF